MSSHKRERFILYSLSSFAVFTSPSMSKDAYPLSCHHCLSQMVVYEEADFFMTDCSHLLCTPCLREKGSKERSKERSEEREQTLQNRIENKIGYCPLCKKTCDAVLVGEEIPDTLHRFLKSPKTLLEDTEKVIHFQMKHLQVLVRVLREKNEKQKYLLEQIRGELLAAKDLKMQLYQVSKENEQLRQCLSDQQSEIHSTVPYHSKVHAEYVV
ncbi:hypothetical protein BDF14DRAFT_1167026 [Spinellus fusiger]|nr:hypothetical protein BDF14DRAFT_1167026 [Spinellus fusiger]